jgi:hypothetical protein
MRDVLAFRIGQVQSVLNQEVEVRKFAAEEEATQRAIHRLKVNKATRHFAKCMFFNFDFFYIFFFFG